MTRFRPVSSRHRLMLSVSAAAIMLSSTMPASAQDAFRRAPRDPAAQAAQAAAARATQNQAASTATRRTIEAFSRAAQARQQMDAAQAAARAQAMAAQVTVPNGLGPNGLQAANGVQTDPSLWIGASAPTQTTADGRTRVEVDQTQSKAILTWDSFNVGRETDLVFDQQGNTSWAVLNRLTDVSADPSRILGSIKADGTVMVLNRNGVIFGGASQVNARNIVAAAGNLSNDQFLTRGIYSQLDNGQYQASFTDTVGGVTVGAGARITTAAPKTVLEGGGYVMLLGSSVENAGSITTDRGQALLAAGDDFVVRQGIGSEAGGGFTRGNEVRGLNDEESESGSVVNRGLITAARGDITLTGRNVTQDGVLLATTSVNGVGTVHLSTSASDTQGAVTLGDGSLTAILPELDSDETALNTQREGLDEAGLVGGTVSAQFDNIGSIGVGSRSQVDIVSGGDVLFAGGSTTLAQGGNVYANAGRRVQTEDGAIIDVSGVRGVALDIGSNAILVNVQGNELRDSPINRDLPHLKNQDVWVDARDLSLLPAGTGGYATDRYYTPGGLLEVGGYIANTGHGIGEWSALGGTIAFVAPEVVAARGSVFNISGGSLDYAAGSVLSTRLQGIDGKLYDIGAAPAGMTFVSVGRSQVVEHSRWGAQYTEVYSNAMFNRGVYVRQEDGYTAGRDAGQLVLSSPTTLFQGEIVADVVTGSRQTAARPGAVADGYALPQDVAALAGSLVLADFAGKTLLQTGSTTEVWFDNVAYTGLPGIGDEIDEQRIGTSWLDSDMLNDFGLGGLRVSTDLGITVSSDLKLANGGQVSLRGSGIEVNADIVARGGDIAIDNELDAEGPIVIGSGATLDVRGLWTNALLEPGNLGGMAFRDGGSVSLRSTLGLTLEEGSVIDASSGAALLAGGTILGGRGGDVTLISDLRQTGVGEGMTLDGDIRAFGVAGGGTLTISTNSAMIIGNSPLLQDGVLTQGSVAPTNLSLTDEVILPAGSILPFDVATSVDRLPVGQPLAAPLVPQVSNTRPLVLAANWTVPAGVTLYTANPSVIYRAGNSAPAGTSVTFWQGTLPAGFVPPANVFPTGLPVPPRPGVARAGTVTATAVTLGAGFIVPQGAAFAQDIAVARPVNLDTSLFRTGFANYDVAGRTGILVQDGTNLTVEMPVYRLSADSFATASGAEPSRALELWTPPEALENPVTGVMTQREGASLRLAASIPGQTPAAPSVGGPLTIGKDAVITVDTGQDVTLEARGQITIEGSIIVPGGDVRILDTQFGPEAFSRSYETNNRSIWLGENSRIDVAGRAYRAIDRNGNAYGLLFDGGSVLIGSVGGERGEFTRVVPSTEAFIIQRPGSIIDASGASLSINVRGPGVDSSTTPLLMASNGGSIAFRTETGLYLDGVVRAASGGAGASGGTLSITLDTPVYAGVGDPNFPHSLPAILDSLRVLTVTQERAGPVLSADLAPSESDPALAVGANLSVDQIEAGGFDSLVLASFDLIRIEGDMSLDLGRSLELRGTIAGSVPSETAQPQTVSLSAPYVLLTHDGPFGSTSDYYPGLVWGPRGTGASASLGYRGSLSAPEGSRITLSGGHVDVRDAYIGVIGRQGFNGRAASGSAENVYDAPGFADVEITSSGDIRFLGSLTTGDNITLTAAQIYPATNTAATIAAGYASGLVSNAYEDRALTIRRSDTSDPAMPYSLFGTLTLLADRIDQGGVVRAPFGFIEVGTGGIDNIRVVASSTLVAPGSITSISGAGLVMPFGGTADGQTYTYGGEQYSLTRGSLNTEDNSRRRPDLRTILIGGDNILIDAGAVVDLSGGGELLGAAFVPGRGGSIDVLQAPLAAAGPGNSFSALGNQVYAILPGYSSAATPEVLGANGGTPALGQQITLTEGLPGLPPGVYTLLPATFATLPGAYRVELGATNTQVRGVTATAGGSFVTGARLGLANTSFIDAAPTLAILTPSTTVRTLSGYNETSFAAFTSAIATTFGTPRGALPADAGFLNIDLSPRAADRPLVVLGDVRQGAAQGGRGGITSVVAGSSRETPIEVRDAASEATEGRISLVDDDLNALKADTLILNGRLLNSTEGTSLGPRVESVILRSGSTLSAAQIFITADFSRFSAPTSIIIESGATIDTTGYGLPGFSAENGLFFNSLGTTIGVSNGGIEILGGLSAGTGTGASLVLEDGAVIRSKGTVLMSATNELRIGEIDLSARELNLALSAINIGDADALAAAAAAGVLPAGWTLTQAQVDNLLRPAPGRTSVERLTLTVGQSLNLIGSVDFSTRGAGGDDDVELRLVTPAIHGLGDADDIATISTGRLVWSGVMNRVVSEDGTPVQFVSGTPGPVLAGGPGTGSGRLQLIADEIEFGFLDSAQAQSAPDLQRLALGFSAVDLTAASGITANNSGTLAVYQSGTDAASYAGGNLTLSTPLLTGLQGSRMTYRAGGAIAVTAPAGSAVADTAAIKTLGGEIRFDAGGTLAVDTSIALPSGRLVLAAGGDVTLGARAAIDLSGRTISFFDVDKHSWGGDLLAASESGSIRQAAGSVIDVSASDNDAGTISVTALGTGGTLALGGTIRGTGGEGFDDGGFDARLHGLADFAALNAQLNAADFTQSRGIMLKTGDIVIGDEVRANHVAIVADGGSLTMNGTINASGMRMGSISLVARDNLTVAPGAVLDAHGTVLQTDAYGAPIEASNRGRVDLTAATGIVTLASGATIDLRSADNVARSKVEINAPRVGEDDIAIEAGGTVNIRGASSVAVNAFRAYAPEDGIINQALLDGIHGDSSAFIDAAGANGGLQGRLAGLSAFGDAFHLRPGVEIRSATPDGDLSVVGDIDLSGYRYGPGVDAGIYGSGEAGVLTIRAGGDLNVGGSISDGFAPPSATPDDNGWGLLLPEGYLNEPITLPSAGVTLAAYTTLPTDNPINFDFVLNEYTDVIPGSTIPQEVETIYVYLQPGTVLTADILASDGSVLYAAGTELTEPVELFSGERLGAGFVVAPDAYVSLGRTLWQAGNGLDIFYSVYLGADTPLPAGSIIPAGAYVSYAGAAILPTRPFGPDGTQGRIYAVAPMLDPGSQSWSMRLAAGSDLASASLRSLATRAALGDGGNLTLDDEHYSVASGAEALSVIRTGTGDLELFAGGDYRQNSLFGVYTAGTQAEGVTDDHQVGLSRQADGTVLGSAYADYEAALAGYRAWYPEHGGDLSVTAQGDLRGYALAASEAETASNPANWLWRQGGEEIAQAAAWWINFGTYVSRAPNFFSEPVPTLVGFSGFGALGGGNLKLTAGGDAGVPSLLSLAVVQTSGVDAAVGSTGRVLADGTLLQTGGGDVTIDVGGAYNRGGSSLPSTASQGGSAYLDGVLTAIRGDITLKAGTIGTVRLGYGLLNPADPRARATGPNSGTGYGGPAIALGDGGVSFRARGDVVLGTVLDPGRLRGNATLAGVDGDPAAPATGESWFTLWTDRSAVDLFSLGGSLTPNTRFNADGRIDGRNFFYPGTLRAVAAGGNIYGRGDELVLPLVLAPFANAELELLAAGSVYGNGYFSQPPLVFAVSGSDPAFMATPFNPAYQLYQQGTRGTYEWERLGGNDWNNTGAIGELFRFGADTATGDLHRNTDPTRIYAVAGDIVDFRYGFSQILLSESFVPLGTDFVSSKAIHARAGRDIVAFGTPVLFGRFGDNRTYASSLIAHADPADLSVISAGRDIFYAKADIAGPGDLVVSAGRNIYQGGRGVFQSTGPIGTDAASAERAGGAGIALLAGVGAAGPDYADFASLYLDPANLADPERPLADQDGKVVKSYDAELAAWLTDRYGWSATEGPALDTFLALSPDEQGLFARSVYFEELRQAGREYNDPDGRRFGSYLRGRQAIATLFPSTSYDGDITMFGERLTYGFGGAPQAPDIELRPFDLDSAVLTDFGGDVQLLAPGGAVTLGVEGVQPSATSGLLTQGSGDVQVFANDSILLGLSRAFTTFGGDITMWSVEGDINAGRGAKTTIVFAPVRRIYDQIGNVALSPTAPTSGAGIGTLNPIPEIPAGDIDLIAPLGTIDAGEAGIRVSGDINLAALQVLNAANIDVQGEATGIPAAAVVNTGALTAASAATTAVVNEAAQLAERARPKPLQEMPTILNVRFLGFGPAE